MCVVPPYMRQDIQDPVPVRLFVMSSGKNSEPHNFMYNPVTTTTTTTVTNTHASSGGASAGKIHCVHSLKSSRNNLSLVMHRTYAVNGGVVAGDRYRYFHLLGQNTLDITGSSAHTHNLLRYIFG